MKKYVAIFVSCLFVIYLLVGCRYNDKNISEPKISPYATVNNFDKASMNLVPGTITPVGLTVEFSSSNDNQCIYGSFYSLEFIRDGKWYQLPYGDKIKNEVSWTKEGYKISKGEKQQFQENWEWLYGKLGAGQYRIIKEISDFRGTGDYDTYYLAAEFTIE